LVSSLEETLLFCVIIHSISSTVKASTAKICVLPKKYYVLAETSQNTKNTKQKNRKLTFLSKEGNISLPLATQLLHLEI
jgi:hypothetical protein